MLGFLRCVLCCLEEEEDRVVHRYETIPDFVQRPNYENQWRSPLLNSADSSKSPIFPTLQAPSPASVTSTYQQSIRTSTSQEKHKTALTEPKRNPPQPVKTSIDKPQVSLPPQKRTQVHPSDTPTDSITKSPHLVNITLPKPQINLHSPNNISTLHAPSLRLTPRGSPQTSITAKSQDAQYIEAQIAIRNVASTRQEKHTTSLAEPKRNPPQLVKTSSDKPQVSLPPPQKTQANPSDTRNLIPSPKPSTVIKCIHKSIEKEAHTNETNHFASSSTSISLAPSLKPRPLALLVTSSSVSSTNASKKSTYVSMQKVTTPLYSVPEDFKELIKKDIVPQVLRESLTPSTYKNYFDALLYAEDYDCEKWSDYKLTKVTVKLEEAAIYMNPSRSNNINGKRNNKKMVENGKEDKFFVTFEIDSVPERRPFLLSRDFVLLRPSGKDVEPFQGVLYRVKSRNLVLAEFGDDFRMQHYSNREYDVSFSFNRICLKRSHQALSAINDALFHNILFPSQTSRNNLVDPPCFTPYLRNLNKNQVSAVSNVLRLNSSPPFLIEGLFDDTSFVVQEAVHQIYRHFPRSRILINAPANNLCDLLMKSLMKKIPNSEIFRANAAFREWDEVDDEIRPLCPFKRECFTCPPLEKLQEFKVVLSTYMSSFRLHNEGISMGHFSHVFLVNASSIMEPEAIVPLANLVDEKTVVVVTGACRNCPSWVRSKIGREYGLKLSYFQRLLESPPYSNFHPLFAAHIRDCDIIVSNDLASKR